MIIVKTTASLLVSRFVKKLISHCITNIIVEIITRTVPVRGLAADCLGTHGQIPV